MRRIKILILAVWIAAAGPAAAQDLEEYTDASNPAAFTLPDFKDAPRSLSDYRGHVVLVNFWASWCPPCIYEMPALKQLQRDLSDRPFRVLAVNVGEKKYRVMEFAKLTNLDLTILLDTDSKTFDAWGAFTMPTSFLIDAQGKIRYGVQGDPGWNLPDTRALIEALLEETATAETGR